MPVFHSEAIGDRAQLNKTKPFVQMSGVRIAFNNCIKLQYFKRVCFCLMQTVYDKFFSNVLTSAFRTDCVACVANMPASTDIIGMKDIKSMYCMVTFIFSDSRVCLRCKKLSPSHIIEQLLLRESNTFLYDLIPDLYH